MSYERLRRCAKGAPTVDGNDYPFEEFFTQSEAIRIIEVTFLDGKKKEITYNPFAEEFRSALNRALALGGVKRL